MKKLIVYGILLVAMNMLSAQNSNQTFLMPQDLSVKSSKQTTKSNKTIYWQNTFEEETPQYSFGHDIGTKDWNVANQSAAPQTWEYSPGLYYFEYLGEYSLTGNETGGNWAWFDVISDLPALGGSGQQVCNTWIQFDNIDLSTAESPKICFYQKFRKLNDNIGTYVDVSVDNGVTWTPMEVNTGISMYCYSDLIYERLLPSITSNQPNVSIRFRWETTDVGQQAAYGWQIDDISIIEAPSDDLSLISARTNFFEYIDYTQPGQEEFFHYSSHYGMIPKGQFEAENASITFNAIVKNSGVNAQYPHCNIKVLNPQGENIYDYTYESSISLPCDMTDTIDLINVPFTLPVGSTIGEYMILFNVFCSTGVDLNESDNSDTAYFIVTNNIYGRDLGNMTKSVGPNIWAEGNEFGESIGTMFLINHNIKPYGIQVYISNETDAGAALKGVISAYNNEFQTYIMFDDSFTYFIEEDQLGKWVIFPFCDQMEILASSENPVPLLVSIECYYWFDDPVDYHNIRLGYDPTVEASRWGTWWALNNLAGWVTKPGWYNGGIGIRLLIDQCLPIDLGPDIQTCDASVTLDAGAGYSFYYWNGFLGEQTHEVTTSGNYTLTVRDSLGTSSSDMIHIQFIDPDTTIIYAGFCEGSDYDFDGTILNEEGIFYFTTTNQETNCDNVVELHLLMGTLFEENQEITICEGQPLFWHGQILSESGEYQAVYTSWYGCDSIYNLNLTVAPLPDEVPVTSVPENGILEMGMYGSINIEYSFANTIYWATCAGVNFTSEIQGVDGFLSLGNNFISGTYQVWAKNQYNCELLLGTYSFVDSNGDSQIIAIPCYNDESIMFQQGDVLVGLYMESSGDGIHLVQESVLDFNGQIEFSNLLPGTYYLGSSIVVEGYGNLASHIYYPDFLIHTDAQNITIEGDTIAFVYLNYPEMNSPSGSNTGAGIVVTENSKNLLPMPNMVVILYNEDSESVIDISITNALGVFEFPNIPNNINAQFFVTSLEHPIYTPYYFHAGIYHHYTATFVVDGDLVYPDLVEIFDVTNKENFVLSPNPTSNTVFVSFTAPKARLSICDLNGKKLIVKNDFAGGEINIEHLKSGVYVVKLETDEGVGVRKLIVE